MSRQADADDSEAVKFKSIFFGQILKGYILDESQADEVEKLLDRSNYQQEIHAYLWSQHVKDSDGNRIPDSPLYCSFCGKTQYEVRKLIQGPTVYICDECSELCVDIIDEKSHSAIIRRTLAFPKEYLHAAASILSSISEYVRVRYPEGNAAVSISQDGEKIIVIIRSEHGEPEVLERLLSEFGMVVSGKISIDSLPIAAIEKLKMQVALEAACLQLKVANETVSLLKEQNLRLLGLSERQSSVSESLSKSIQMSLTCSTELGRFLSRLSQKEGNPGVQILLNSLEDKLEVGITDSDESELKNKLTALESKKPGILNEILKVAKDTGASGGGSLLAMWIAQVLGLL